MSKDGHEGETHISSRGFEKPIAPDNAVPVYLVQMPPEPEDAQADLYRLWQLLKSYRLLIGVVVLLTTIPATIYAIAAQPTYRAQILVSSVQDSEQQGGLSAIAGQLGGLASVAGLNLGGGAEKEQAVAVLESRKFTAQFISDNKLLPILFEDDWDEQTASWKSSDPEDHPSMDDAYELFDRDIRAVREDVDTGLITLTIDWSDREQAAEWANELITRLNNHLREKAIEDANFKIEYLEAELESTGVLELRQAIFGLIEQQIELAMLANTQKEFAFRVLDPATPADVDDYVWPLRAVIVVFAIFAGLIIGTAIALILHAANPRPQNKTVRGLI